MKIKFILGAMLVVGAVYSRKSKSWKWSQRTQRKAIR